MSVYAEGKHRIELHKARSQFFEWAGQFDESSYDFEVKMSLFMDWYLIDRPFANGKPPIDWVDEDQASFNEEERKIAAALKNSQHGLYEAVKVKKESLLIKDLISSQKYLISNVRILSAFNKEQFFEARVVELDEKLIFSESFCFHPPQASKYILKEIKSFKKKFKKSSEDEAEEEKKKILNKLFRMKHKSEQYKHLKIEDVYCEDSKVKV